ncbi:porin [Aquincola sp. S2]|uniref:Porin n=1 Tax=Pseudaquabacterium terrae TaxID=2732868 RepID=A0ABX2EFD1_9BURK|nr:porin [Aquabacterium terrae]NRF67296.1 porin [Aquabacterium terrae]
MNQKPLWAAGLGLACISVMAQSSVTVSGTLDAAVRRVDNGSLGSMTSQVSGANSTSKLILRGIEDLGGGLSAGFYLDSTIGADTGAAGGLQFWDRRSTVSLASVKLGELRLGRDWVPTHLVWSAFDPFSTLGVASANTFRSLTASRALGQAFGSAPETQAANPTLRVSNAVEYFLPPGLGGFYGMLIVTQGENGTTAAGFTDGDGFRLGWTGRGVHAAAAQFTTRNASGGQRFRDQAFGVSYEFSGNRVGIAQRRWLFGSDRTVSTQVGALIAVGAGQIKLTYVHADQTGATAALSANDARLLGAGYVYNLSKRTALYVHAARVDNRGAAVFTIPGGPAVSASPSAANYFGGKKSTAFESGIRHDF